MVRVDFRDEVCDVVMRAKNKSGLARCLALQGRESATTYFPAKQYHRRPGLNCCVRDGNRCDPGPMITDKPRRGLSPVPDMYGLD